MQIEVLLLSLTAVMGAAIRALTATASENGQLHAAARPRGADRSGTRASA
jgi:hypothetical protein